MLKLPIVVFSSIDSYPVIPLVPRSSPLTVVPIHVAFNQSGKGHYDPVFAAKTQPCQEIEKKSQNTNKAGEEQKTKKDHFAAPMGQGVSVFNICKDATQHANASIVETHMEQKMWL